MTASRSTRARIATVVASFLIIASAHAQLPIITGIDPTDTTMGYDVSVEYQKMENRDEHKVLHLRGNVAVRDNLRVRLETSYVDLNYRDSQPDTGFESQNGMGDFSAEVLYKAYVQGPDTVAYGLRLSLGTATEDELGQGGSTLTPLVAWSRQCPYDLLIAPVVEWTFGPDLDATPYHGEGDLNEIRVKTVVGWEPMTPEVSWLTATPTLAIDLGEEDDRSFELDLEYGLMFTETQAVFVRSGMATSDNDLDWFILVGFRHVLREWVLFE